MTKYRIRAILVPEGGRLFTIIDSDTGQQSPFVALWADHLTRTSRPNTAKAYIEDLKLFMEWCDRKNIDLSARISNMQALSRLEVADLAMHFECRRVETTLKVAASTFNRRITAIEDFLRFHIERYLFRASNNNKRYQIGLDQLKRFSNALKKHKKTKSEIAISERPTRPVEPDELQKIFSIIHPDSKENPFRSKTLKIRNYCIIAVAIECLLRKAEIVLLEIDDFNSDGNPTIRIKQPNLKNRNLKKDGASVKTRGRELPISNELSSWICLYLNDYRQHKAPKKISKALFVSEKTDERLSAGSIGFILHTVSKKFEELHQQKIALHAHMLRVTGATIARKKLDEVHDGKGPLSKSAEIQEVLTYMGGWSNSSNMPRHYSKQAIAEKIRGLTHGK